MDFIPVWFIFLEFYTLMLLIGDEFPLLELVCNRLRKNVLNVVEILRLHLGILNIVTTFSFQSDIGTSINRLSIHKDNLFPTFSKLISYLIQIKI